MYTLSLNIFSKEDEKCTLPETLPLKVFVSGGPSEGSASDCDLGLEGEGREVRYTDQEYEDDSSDCEDVLLEVPSLPGCQFYSPSNANKHLSDITYQKASSYGKKRSTFVSSTACLGMWSLFLGCFVLNLCDL